MNKQKLAMMQDMAINKRIINTVNVRIKNDITNQ